MYTITPELFKGKKEGVGEAWEGGGKGEGGKGVAKKRCVGERKTEIEI